MPGGASLARLRLRPRSAAPAATIPASAGSLGTASSARLPAISLETLLSTCTVGASIASLTVVAKGTVAGAPARLLSVAARSISLRLIGISGTVLILARARTVGLICARTILLVRSRTILLVRSGPVLLIEIRLISAVILGKVSAIIVLSLIAPVVLVLGLITVLIEFRLGKVGVAGVAIEVIRAVVVVAVDIRIDVIAIDVGIHVVAVVVVIAVDEGVRG